jgi:hypothetical protein
MIAKYKHLLPHLVLAVVLLFGLLSVVMLQTVSATAVTCPDGFVSSYSGGTTKNEACRDHQGAAPSAATPPPPDTCDQNKAISGCCSEASTISDLCNKPQGDSAATIDKCTKQSCDFINNYINPAIKLVSAIVGLVITASIIYGAIQYSSSGGDPQKAANAKARILKTLVALVTYIFLYSFLQFILPGGVLHK